MPKLVLTDVVSGFASTTVTNANNAAIVAALENTLSRDGTTPNQMASNLDMNSNRITNLPVPVNLNEAARLQDVQNAITGVTTANFISNSPAGNITSNTVQGALNELDGRVGFIQVGTGAVTRTPQNKMRDIVSVKDFGAVGNGVANDAPAIQNAITAAGYGGSVYFPKGTYAIGATISVPPLSGAETSINFYGDGVGSIIRPLVAMTQLFNVTGSDTQFDDLAFANTSGLSTHGLNISLLSSSAAFSSSINRCYFYFFTDGLRLAGQNYDITENFFQNNVNAVNFTNDGRNTFLDGNYVLGGNTGFKFSKVLVQAEGLRITNNTILATAGSGAGISITDGLEILIAHNIIDQLGVGSPAIYMPGGTITRIKILDNWLNGGSASYGLFISGNNSEITISDNTITGMAATTIGISLANTNTVRCVFNNFIATLANDYSTSGLVNETRFGNSANNAVITSGQNSVDFWPRVWNTFTTTVTASGGTLGSLPTTATMRWFRVGSIFNFTVNTAALPANTGSGAITMTLPINMKSGSTAIAVGRENALSGSMLQGQIGGTLMSIVTFNNTYPGATGSVIFMSGSCEIQ